MNNTFDVGVIRILMSGVSSCYIITMMKCIADPSIVSLNAFNA